MSSLNDPHFKPSHTLLEQGPGINVVKISPDGRLLLSGAMDGTLCIWDMTTGRNLQTWNLSGSRGITCAAWCPVVARGSSDTFVVGNALGQITVYSKGHWQTSYDYASSEMAFGGPVEDVAFDANHRRLAAVGQGALKVYALNATYSLSPIYGTAPRPNIARTVIFYARGTCVCVCYLQSKHITGYTISPWSVHFDVDIETPIGHAALQDDGDLFVTNLRDGLDIYSFPPTSLPKQCIKLPVERHFPLTVAVSSVDDVAIIGGEDGMARVYNPRIGLVVEVLSHGNHRSLIQLVDIHVSRKGSGTTVVTGCTDDNYGSIKVWVSTRSHCGAWTKEALSHVFDSMWARRYAFYHALISLHNGTNGVSQTLFAFFVVYGLTFICAYWILPPFLRYL